MFLMVETPNKGGRPGYPDGLPRNQISVNVTERQASKIREYIKLQNAWLKNRVEKGLSLDTEASDLDRLKFAESREPGNHPSNEDCLETQVSE